MRENGVVTQGEVFPTYGRSHMLLLDLQRTAIQSLVAMATPFEGARALSLTPQSARVVAIARLECTGSLNRLSRRRRRSAE